MRITNFFFCLLLPIFCLPGCRESNEDCAINSLSVDTGNCNTDGTYSLTLNFDHSNAGNDFFDLYVRGDLLLDFYSLSDLPLTLDNFQPSGLDYDFIKVCINDNPDCCREIEFMPPTCNTENNCSISGLEAAVGDCNMDGTYSLTLNFDVLEPENNFYEVFIRNNEYLGLYSLENHRPLIFAEFQPSGFDYDYIKVCINDNPDCCREIEFMPPDCSGNNACEVSNLVAEAGACTSAETYNLTIDFDHTNAGNDFFDIFIRNNVSLGFFPLSDLPLTLNDFNLSGFDYDYIKVCINDNPDCCREIEFMPPDC